MKAFRLPFGAPGDGPPCILHLPFNIAGDWHGFAEAEGVELDPKLKITKLRAIDNADERERDERLKLPLPKIKNLFNQPPFVNCAGWDQLSEEGAPNESLVFHGALYFIPMLIFYGGGRREEYCGLMIDDVIEDNGSYPYLHIAKNKFRRIKNSQSKRNIACMTVFCFQCAEKIFGIRQLIVLLKWRRTPAIARKRSICFDECLLL